MSPNTQTSDLMADGLDRIADVSRFLRLSTSTVYTLIAEGTLPSVKIGKARRIPHRAVVQLAAANLVSRTDD